MSVAPVGRYIATVHLQNGRGVLMALILSGFMSLALYAAGACDSKPGSLLVYLSGHPADRFVPQRHQTDNIVIVGLDNASAKT